MLKRILIILLAAVMLLGAAGCKSYPETELKPKEYLMGDDPDQLTSYMNEDLSRTPQLNESDIREMNGGDAYFVYGEPDGNGNRYVTFLNGKYYKEKVKSSDDAVRSLNGVAKLLGLAAGSEFFAAYGENDDDGYTYWVLQQRYGGETVQYATVRVIVDPDGYTAGLASSVVPNLGIAKNEEGITAGEAEENVEHYMEVYFPDTPYTMFRDNTKSVVAQYGLKTYHCFAVYTTNPKNLEGSTFDMPYLEHIVTYDGQYIFCNQTNTLESRASSEAYENSVYFDNLEADTWTGEVTLHDGSKKTITVPVAKSKADGKYYLADVDRKIIIADYSEFAYNDLNLVFISSDTNSGWKDYHLLEMYNYGRAYDFYAEVGIKSPDGFGTPMLILTDWKENGQDVNNACCYGNIDGWIAFGASAIGSCEECLDVIAHEFTHGVTKTAMCGNKYMNETGAINEAFSDIMGEICEHMTLSEDGVTPESTDELWYHGQNKETPTRCASNPNEFQQPAYVGDIYYMMPTPYEDSYNDQGGVHFNSSLLTYVAWVLNDRGMSLANQRSLWLTTIQLMTPGSSYDEVKGALFMSIEINGFDEKWKTVIEETYKKIGLTGDRTATAAKAVKSGCGRIEAVAATEEVRVSVIMTYNEEGYNTYLWLVPDENGYMSALLPEGKYILKLIITDLKGINSMEYFLTPDGRWSTNVRDRCYVPVEADRTISIGTIR